MRRILLIIGLISASSFCLAQASRPALQAVNENVFKIGGVTFDKLAKTVSFPAMINLRAGAIEYLLVTETGKAHESLLTTKVQPSDLHIAILLLGAKASAETTSQPPAQIDQTYLKSAPELKGDKVEIELSWKQDGRDRGARAEEFIFNSEQSAPMSAGPWVYTGSVIYEGKFLAQVDGSIIALVTDPEALINNPRPGHDDDTIWNIRSEKLPPEGMPIEVILKLLPDRTQK